MVTPLAAPSAKPDVNQDSTPHEISSISPYLRAFAEGNLEFVKHMSTNDLVAHMNNLDAVMEREIDGLRQRYNIKRQPILDAKDQKRKSQQNF